MNGAQERGCRWVEGSEMGGERRDNRLEISKEREGGGRVEAKKGKGRGRRERGRGGGT